jgi:hypothetical protein
MIVEYAVGIYSVIEYLLCDIYVYSGDAAQRLHGLERHVQHTIPKLPTPLSLLLCNRITTAWFSRYVDELEYHILSLKTLMVRMTST